jgi:4-hydroxy-2-oxoheptanedioate aldolase
MELPVNPFKRALRAGRQQVGLWSSLAHPTSVEILAGSSFDWLLLDMEHSPNDVNMVLSQLQAAASGGNAHPIVRPPWNEAVIIKRLLDAGAQTLLLPFVQNADEARRAVAATRYPPDGVRGFASSARAQRYGRVKDYHARAADELCVLVQVETPEALKNLEAIAAVDGVDGIFIGPGDLSSTMGMLGRQNHPDVVSTIEAAIRRIVATGKAAGILTSDETLARRYIAAGTTFTAVGSDVGLLVRGAEQLAGKFRPQ